MENEQHFFDFAAEVGLTKHLGGHAATEELAELCHIDKDTYVLDVGCGAGTTPCFLAKTVGCRVVGVDISEGMIERSRERARREGLSVLADGRGPGTMAMTAPSRRQTETTRVSPCPKRVRRARIRTDSELIGAPLSPHWRESPSGSDLSIARARPWMRDDGQ